MPIIAVEHLSKTFQLGQIESLKTILMNQARRFVGKPVEERADFKALDDVSFKIDPGEVVGVIGHNGAGKSTLLKLISRITSPTAGRVTVTGRIAPLIEVGAGFVPDLTGRENVYLNGSILGLSRKDIDRKFDEIVGFAEMKQFIDTPVKRYSSGMKVKLAFAVATSIEAEILIVDEVLAVGDLAFQRKCFERMEGLINDKQRTVLLVSHNIRQVERICRRVIMLDHGRIIGDGSAPEICNRFYALNDLKIQSNASMTGRVNTTGDIELKGIRLLDSAGIETDTVETGSDSTFQIEFRVNERVDYPKLVFGLHTIDFFYVSTLVSPPEVFPETLVPGDYKVAINILDIPLLSGTYSVRLSVDVGTIVKNVFYGENLFVFCAHDPDLIRSRPEAEGILRMQARWGKAVCECSPASFSFPT